MAMLSAVNALEKDTEIMLVTTARCESQAASFLAYKETHVPAFKWWGKLRIGRN